MNRVLTKELQRLLVGDMMEGRRWNEVSIRQSLYGPN